MKICKQSSEKQIYYPDIPFNTNENNVVLDNDGKNTLNCSIVRRG